jgi:hypothetical protein
MAYIGSSAVSPLTTQIRPRDEFVGNGTQREYVLSQEVPGGFESNVLAFVDNVPQEPISAYVIKDIQRLTLSNASTNSVKNVTIAKPTGSAFTGVVDYALSGNVYQSVNALLTGSAPFAGRSGNTLRLEQRLISNNNLIASITLNKTDSLSQPNPFVGITVSGTFLNNGITEYVIIYDVTANDYLALTPSGLAARANTAAIISDDKYFTVFSHSTEIEAPKIGDQITQAGSNATGIVAAATSSFIDVIQTSTANFVTVGNGGQTISYKEPKSVNYLNDTITYENVIAGTFSITASSTLKFKALQFTGYPKSGQKILINHMGGSNYQINPTAGSVTDLALSDNLKTFTVDKFTATQGQQTFALSKTPVSVQSILVTLNGVVQTDTTGYTLQNGNELVTQSPLNAGVNVNVLHLGFSTVSRNSFTDGSITAAALQDLTITGNKIANSTITSSKLAAGTAIANIGYTPHNPSSGSLQSYTGAVTFNGVINTNGNIVFPGSANPSVDANTLDEYREGDFSPTLVPATIGATPIALSITAGKFIKIGRLVHVSIRMVVSSLGVGNSGSLKIGSLPFTINNSGNVINEYSPILTTNTTSMTNPYVNTIPNTLTLQITTDGSTDATVSNLTGTSTLLINLTYIANA